MTQHTSTFFLTEDPITVAIDGADVDPEVMKQIVEAALHAAGQAICRRLDLEDEYLICTGRKTTFLNTEVGNAYGRLRVKLATLGLQKPLTFPTPKP